jgi:signal transduction histidine kinase
LLEKIARQTFRASEIVNSLLNFSRTSPTEFVMVDINKVVRETLTLVEHQFAQSEINVKVALDQNIPKVKASPGKLQQVFLNLFLNARDAMESGGVLSVETRHGDRSVRIIVADTGAGILPENLARIFDPFFTTKGIRKGTGLGLSVSYGIVREHGGEIEVESRPGQGARFTLTFPEFAPAAVREPAPAREVARTLSPAVSRTETSPSVPSPIVARSDRLIQ